MGTILASKSHPKIDQKIDQILDGFWNDFGFHMRSNLGPFWLQKSIENQGRFLNEKSHGIRKGSAAEAGLRRVLFFAQRLIYLDIRIVHADKRTWRVLRRIYRPRLCRRTSRAWAATGRAWALDNRPPLSFSSAVHGFHTNTLILRERGP